MRETDDQFLPWFAACGTCLTCGNRQHFCRSPPRIGYLGDGHGPCQPSRYQAIGAPLKKDYKEAQQPQHLRMARKLREKEGQEIYARRKTIV